MSTGSKRTADSTWNTGRAPLKIIIIGNGITGVTAALTIRDLQPDWDITIVSAESDKFFSRTALMYIYMGHMRLVDTQPYAPDFWTRQRLDLIRDRVTRIDTAGRRVDLEKGGSLAFDKLLIATGSQSNKFGWPGQDLDGVLGLYNLQDLAWLEEQSARVEHGVIVGGGLIGIELAEMMHSRGMKVTILAREDSYWNNVLPSAESALINEVIRDNGIDLRLNTELKEIEDDGQGHACAVVTGDGERLACQLVGLTAGVSPNLTALADSDIPVARGILVDFGFRTQVADVFAAGDCAEIVTPEGERNRIEQLWYTGKMHGQVVGRNMAGHDVLYDRGIWFNSAKFFDLEWHTYGQVPGALIEPDPGPERALYWQHANRRHAFRLVLDQDRVIGVNTLGIRFRHRVCERWIAEERSAAYVLDHLQEAVFDPEFSRRHNRDINTSLKEQLR
jgi:NADPH-dependent 2,4-dienoyl-CoA reductase/sulfur reductase-like enzyme